MNMAIDLKENVTVDTPRAREEKRRVEKGRER